MVGGLQRSHPKLAPSWRSLLATWSNGPTRSQAAHLPGCWNLGSVKQIPSERHKFQCISTLPRIIIETGKKTPVGRGKWSSNWPYFPLSVSSGKCMAASFNLSIIIQRAEPAQVYGLFGQRNARRRLQSIPNKNIDKTSE